MKLKPADYAAYLLDRADQYETDSGCWVALAEAAHNVMIGEVENAKKSGELDASLYERLERMTHGSWASKPVVPTAGTKDLP